MAITRHIAAILARDLMKALAVLALVSLSLAHQPAFATSADHAAVDVAVSSSYCGDGPVDTSHAPCHACRIGGGADLPPPCGGLVHLPSVVEPAFPELAAAAFALPLPDIPAARGPPALA